MENGKSSYSGSWELEGKKACEKYFMLSLAYAEASCVVCGSILRKEMENNWSQGMVILSLFYHSYELFYKGQ